MNFSYLRMKFVIVICLYACIYALYQMYKNDSSIDSNQLYQDHTHKLYIKETNHPIIQSDLDLENILSNMLEMDWVIIGKEQYNVPEYFRTHYTD